MSRDTWTQDDEKYLIEWYGEKSAEEIADALEKKKRSVYYKARVLGLQGRTRRWTDDEIAVLKENYVTLGARRTAEVLGRTLASVHTKIREVGGGNSPLGPRNDWTEGEEKFLLENYQVLDWDKLEKGTGRDKAAMVRKARELGIKRYVDPFPFFEEWSEEVAYILGFFAADGWVAIRGPKSIRIGFSQKESDIIYTLKKTIGTGRITEKSNGMYEYYVHSVKLYDWLCEVFGFDVHQKSHTLLWPDVPKEYVRHFTRGAFDGDGSIFRTKDELWSIDYASSSKDFIESLFNITIENIGVRLSVGENKTNVYHARTTGVGAVCFIHWLYKNCSIALERKKALAEEAMYPRGLAQKNIVTEKMKEMFPEVLATYNIR
ncbi:MAG: hypothetical protein GF347_00620 [Candidatus Moranbacteria bacterium]|nr:hypothetical protein [Candidatus Moranbacteria bacterium]